LSGALALGVKTIKIISLCDLLRGIDRRIDCHHESRFEALANEVIFLCLKRGRLLRKTKLRRSACNDCVVF